MKNDFFAKINKLLPEILKKEKTVDLHILKYFKKNDYNQIRKKDLISIFTKKFMSNPDKFINYNKTKFDSKNSFTYSLDITLKKDLFKVFNQKKIKYIKINAEKTLEYLNTMKKQILFEKGANTVIKRRKIELENEEKNTNNSLLNKKRNRQNMGKENSKDKDEIKYPKKNNNSKKIKSRNNPRKKDNEENVTSEKIYNNITFHQSHLSKYTFKDKILSNNSAPLSNNSYYFNSENYEEEQPPLPKKDLKEELLSKSEEEIFKIISKEIQPLEKKLDEMNSLIAYKRKKLVLVQNLLKEMNQNMENFKTIKKDYYSQYNDIRINFKCVEDQLRIFKISESVIDEPFMEEIQKDHNKFIRNILKKSKSLFDINHRIANQLNNYEISFTNAKITIENDLKEILEVENENKACDNIVDSFKNMFKSNFKETFKKLKSENNNNKDKIDNVDNYNEMKNIYEKNSKIRSEYDAYINKVKSLK